MIVGLSKNRPSQIALLLAGIFVAGCGGYSEEEMQAQLDKYNALASQNAETEAELAEARRQAEELAQELEAMGFKLSAEGAEKERLMDALNEYKQRAAALERIKSRFENLRKKLEELTKLGLKIEIRKNRMVISLPGDVLFASGKAELEDKGIEILSQVAKVIREDDSLANRTYQVAGHTDNEPIQSLTVKKEFKDNWGLSLMRARSVLLYLIRPTDDEKEPGGGLDPKLWSASGYGDTDPIAGNVAAEDKQKNRRVELIMMPNVEEMLDLKSLVTEEPAAEAKPAQDAGTEDKGAKSEDEAKDGQDDKTAKSKPKES